MQRTLLHGKIHRATVTTADIHYVGSVTVDADLMAAGDFVEGELVQIVDVTNGARLETYLISGDAGSGVVGINGAAAHLIFPGDLVIIMSFVLVDEAELHLHGARVVHVDADNKIIEVGGDSAQPAPGQADQVPTRHLSPDRKNSSTTER